MHNNKNTRQMCIKREKKKRGKTVQSEPLMGIWKFTNAVITQIFDEGKEDE